MPIVPQYQPGQIQTRPLAQQRLSVRASADDFGAAQARGLGAISEGLGQAANAMQQLRDLEDIARAKDADNQFAAWVRERSYGEGGYMTLEGRAAVEARELFAREAVAKRQEFGASLSGAAAAKYKIASEARLNGLLEGSIVHAANARKEWFKIASTDRINTFAEDAFASYSNPTKVAKNIAAGQAELRTMAELQGWDADTLKNKEAEFVSGIHKNIALRIAQNDPLAADKYRKEYASALSASHQYDLEAALGAAVKEAEAIRLTENILRAGRSTSTTPAKAAKQTTMGMTGPTQARAILTARSVGGATRSDAIDALDGAFATNLAAMIEDAPPSIREGLGIISGYRSERVQADIISQKMPNYGFSDSDVMEWNADLATLGPAKTSAKWAVRLRSSGMTKDVGLPGGSLHQQGQAVDLAWNGGSFADAPAEVQEWIHANAGKYSIYSPMAHEPWHVEPTKARSGSGTLAPKNASVAPRAAMPSFDQIEAQLAEIADPVVRDQVRKRLNAQIEIQNRAAEEASIAAKTELWRVVEAGGTPDQVPQDIRVIAGMAAITQAWSYIEETAKRGAPKNDETLVYKMRRDAAENPDEFAKIDLNDYRGKFSSETFKEMTDLQTMALTNQRKLREEGLALTTAFAQAEKSLEALGITTIGKEGRAREQIAQRIAAFQNMLAAQMAEFKAANAGKNPNQMEIHSMVNRLLLPVVVEKPSSIWGTTQVDISKTGQNFLFDLSRVGNLGADSTVSVSVDYEKIPPADRIEIEITLEEQYGRKPSEIEVETAYAAYLISTATAGN